MKQIADRSVGLLSVYSFLIISTIATVDFRNLALLQPKKLIFNAIALKSELIQDDLKIISE